MPRTASPPNTVPCARGRQPLAALAARPAVAAWLERELQALLLQGDVALVAQHVLAALRAASNPKPASNPGRARGPAGPPASRRSAPAAEPPEDEVGSPGQHRKLWTPCWGHWAWAHALQLRMLRAKISRTAA